MTNRKLVVPTDSVKLQGSDEALVVRGLSVNDFKTLINMHRDVAALLFDKIVSMKDDNGVEALTTVDDMVMMIIDEFPLVLADFIALAADQLDNADAFLSLPVGAQFDAISKICRLTFGEEDAAKKLLATVVKIMGTVNAKLGANSP